MITLASGLLVFIGFLLMCALLDAFFGELPH